MDVTVIGMGRMGQALAGRLLEGGHDLTIWNRTAGRAPDLVARGATEAASLAAAVSAAAVVVTCLAEDDAVRTVALGDDGIVAAAGPDLVYVDASTISPQLSRELGERVPRFASMPVLGSPAQVASGDAIFLLGAGTDVTGSLEPLLASLTRTVRRYPQPALAATAKLASNLLLLDGVVALAESFAVGRAGGLSDDQLRELLGESPMVAAGLKNRFEGVLTGDQDAWWTPGLGAKDARLALEVVEAAGGALPATAAVRDVFERTALSAAHDDDITAVTRLYRQ